MELVQFPMQFLALHVPRNILSRASLRRPEGAEH